MLSERAGEDIHKAEQNDRGSRAQQDQHCEAEKRRNKRQRHRTAEDHKGPAAVPLLNRLKKNFPSGVRKVKTRVNTAVRIRPGASILSRS